MTVPTKLLAGTFIVAAIGVPVLETWRALLLAACVLALVSGATRSGRWRVGVALGIVAALLVLRAVLPRADIAEAHNAFLVLGPGEALERGLPEPVFRSWKAQFDALYPPDNPPYEQRSQWRNADMPRAAFTQSADAIWRAPRYTRQVDAIDFDNLGAFRGGFANEIQYNFWTGELLREAMPFYAMYELTSSSVGSALAWTGQVFWEREDGRFEEIVHRDMASRRIEQGDAGKRIFAAFFPKRGPFHFRLELSMRLRVAAWLERVAALAGALAVLFLLVRPRWPSWTRATALFSLAYVVLAAFLAVSAGKYLGATYPPQGGGDDGLVHDGWGHTMALLAGSGDVMGALRGFEDVYWFTPGMRYFRMAEKLLFGDTNLLYMLVVACWPVGVFYLVRHFVSSRWALAATAAFCVLPVGNPSLLAHIANAKLGYGEAVAGGLFLVGLALMLHTQPRWGGTERNLHLVALAGAALAASIFIRPNFVIAVAWLGAAYAWVAFRRGDTGSIVALTLGLSLALWMPFHNWYYGRELYMISKAGAPAVPLGPGDYVSALADIASGRLDTNAVVVTSRQLQGWLWDPGLLVRPQLRLAAWAMHGVKLVALLVTGGIVLGWLGGRFRDRPALGVVAVTAILAHAPMLVIFSTYYRYGMLGWDLSVLVLLAWAVGRAQPSPPVPVSVT